MCSYIKEGSILVRNESLISGVLFFLLTYRDRGKEEVVVVEGCGEVSVSDYKRSLCCSLTLAKGCILPTLNWASMPS